MMCCFCFLCETHLFSSCCHRMVHVVNKYLVLAVGVADAGDVCVGKQEVECDGQEGQVSHQREVLSVQNHLVQPVRERQPIQSLTHTLQVGVPHTHGQIIIIQTLRKRDRFNFFLMLVKHGSVFSIWSISISKISGRCDHTWETFSYSPLEKAKFRMCWNLWAPPPEPGASSNPAPIRFLKEHI